MSVDWQAGLNAVLLKRGYLIVGRTEPAKIGQVLDTVWYSNGWSGEEVMQPFRVMRETTREDFIGQMQIISAPDYHADFYSMRSNYFYVVATD